MIWIILLVAAVSFVVTWMINSLGYWRKRNVTYKRAWPLLGNLQDFVLQRKNFAYIVQELYNEYPDKRYFGLHLFAIPTLLVRDLDLIKDITVKDFDHFVDHMSVSDAELEPIFGKNLFVLTGKKWRDMRNTLSPSFTGNKIRTMFTLMSKCARQFNDHFLGLNKDTNVVEMKDLASRFAVDVIASCAFGLECNSIKVDSEFHRMGVLVTKRKFLSWIKALIQVLTPSIAKKFEISLVPAPAAKFFESVIKETLKEREEKNIIRPDMIHILMEARKGKKVQEDTHLPDVGFAAVDHEDPKEKDEEKPALTTNEIVAQGFLFFLAGFETVSVLLSHMAHELAINPEIQEKLQKEIDEVFEGNDNNFSYESLVKMKYLDMVVSETLRKWPPAAATNRECVKEYRIKGSGKHGEEDVVIEKGTGIMLPIFGFHRDHKYFPNPEKFDPERFNDENKRNILPYTYWPFGLGPRNCIGSRFALLEAKVMMAYLLSKFDITVVKKTQIPLVLSPKTTSLCSESFWLGLKKRAC